MHRHTSDSESVYQTPAENDTDCEPCVAETVAKNDSGEGVEADSERPNSAAHISRGDKPCKQLSVMLRLEGRTVMINER